MKSLNFTLLEEELRSYKKKQTYRCIFIPNFYPGEIIQLKFKGKELYQAKVLEVYPKQLKDITLKEAKEDGFNSVKEMQKGIMKLNNNVKSLEHWGFFIKWEPISTIMDYLEIEKKQPIDLEVE